MRLRFLVLAGVLLGMTSSLTRADVLTVHPIWSFDKDRAASIFDSRRQRLVIVGGIDPAAPQTQTEVLDLSGTPTWLRPAIQGPMPPTTMFDAAVYDSLRDRMILLTPGAGSGVWSLALTEPMAWTEMTPTGAKPDLGSVSVVYDSKRDRIVGHGGTRGLLTVDATWTLSLGTAPAWSTLATAGAAPPTRAEAAAMYDATTDRMLVYGGVTTDSTGSTRRNDTWQLSFAGGIPTWSLVPLANPPPLRRLPAAIFDRTHSRFVVVGGAAPSTQETGDARFLDPGNLSAGWQQLPSSPAPRWGAAAVYDPIGQRMIVAGGISNGGVRGDVWQLTLGAQPGPWKEIPVIGANGSGTVFAGYDPIRHRFAALRGDAPWFLSVIDRLWHPTEVVGGPPSHVLRSFYDTGSNTFWAFNLDSLYSIHPGLGEAWTRTWIPGTRPQRTGYAPTTFFDAARQRILVIGGYESGFNFPYSEQFWTLSLGPTPAWSLIADSTPLGLRETPAILDTRRDRVLFFGGSRPNGSVRPGALAGLFTLDLANLSFAIPATSGVEPSARYLFAAAYDSLRDRMILFGGAQYSSVQGGVYYLQFGPSDPNGKWSRNDPENAAVGATSSPGGMDPMLDRFFVGNRESLDELAWSPTSPAISLECPLPAVWTPGSILPLALRVIQSVNAPHTYRWAVTSSREWPGFPIVGSQGFMTAETIEIPIGIPVPDSAAGGSDTLRFVITDLADAAVSDTCEVLIGGDTSGAPPEFRLLAFTQSSWLVTRSEFRVSFSLPGEGAARLELFDLAGRRMLLRRLPGLGPGTHQVGLAAAATLRPGVYFLRLTQAGAHVTARAVVLGGR